MEFTKEQLEIFEEFENGKGNVIVEALAGTGKTFSITHGIARAPESKICYTVFGKKNKIEAEGKIRDDRVKILTLNGLGYAFCLRQWPGSKPSSDIEHERVAKALGKGAPPAVVQCVFKAVEFIKNGAPFARREDVANTIYARALMVNKELEKKWPIERLADAVLEVLRLSKIRDPQNRISYNDQVWLPVVMGWVQPWYKLIVVDEAQDLSPTQIYMLDKTLGKGGRMIWVGDSMQTLFEFRSASIDTLDNLKIKYNAKVLPLTLTWRCPKKVVELAQKIVPTYQAHESAPEGEVFDNVPTEKVYDLAKPSDAIISRKNAPLVGICLNFYRKCIPAKIEGKDVGAALLSIIKEQKASTIEELLIKVQQWAINKVSKLGSLPGTESQIDIILDQNETIKVISEDSKTIEELVAKINNLFADDIVANKQYVVLTSTHKAKGLEYDNVFLLQNTYVADWSTKKCGSNCLKYVAITRAKKTLTWLI